MWTLLRPFYSQPCNLAVPVQTYDLHGVRVTTDIKLMTEKLVSRRQTKLYK